jgi:ribosomal protein L44E
MEGLNMDDKKPEEKPPQKCLWRGGGKTACQQDKWHEGQHDEGACSEDRKERMREVDRELKHRVTLGWSHDVRPSKERKAKTRKRVAIKDDLVREGHVALSTMGVPRRKGGGKLGFKKRLAMAEKKEA